LEAQQALNPAGHPLRPGRQVLTTDRPVTRTLQYRDAFEIEGRDRMPRVLGADPALAGEKTGYPLPLRDVLGVVPVVELVLGDVREIHRRDQNTLRHDHFPPIVSCPDALPGTRG